MSIKICNKIHSGGAGPLAGWLIECAIYTFLYFNKSIYIYMSNLTGEVTGNFDDLFVNGVKYVEIKNNNQLENGAGYITSAGFVLPIASDTTLGGVLINGNNLSIASDGVFAPRAQKRAKRSERSGTGGRLSGKRACVISGDNSGCKTIPVSNRFFTMTNL